MPKISIVDTIDLIIIHVLLSLWLIHWDTSAPLSRVTVQTTTNNRFAYYVATIRARTHYLGEFMVGRNCYVWQYGLMESFARSDSSMAHSSTNKERLLHLQLLIQHPPSWSIMVQCCVHTFETLSHFDKSRGLNSDPAYQVVMSEYPPHPKHTHAF